MKDKTKKTRLLLVDDEEEFLIATSQALERRGFEVTTAANGSDALELLTESEYDVAVVDVKMPGLAGDELFREIKRRWPYVPVVMLTGHGTMTQAFTISKEGVHDYLTKPCDMNHLAKVARQAAYERRARRVEESGKDGVRKIMERYQD